MKHAPALTTTPTPTDARMSLAVSQWTASVTRRLFLRQFLILATAYMFIYGTAILVLRVAVNLDRTPLLWGATGLLVLMVIAAILAYQRRPTFESVLALLDSHNKAGGLHLAGAHQAGWSHRMTAVKLPGVQWRSGRQWLLAGLAAFFVAAAFAVPAWVTQAGKAPPLDISGPVAQMTRQLETLKQESVLQQEQATELSEKLKQVQADAKGTDPVKTWESLDHIKAQLQDAAAQAVEKASQETQTLDQTQMLAQALAQQPDALSPDQLARAMQTLQEMAQAAAAENKKLAEMMKKEGIDGSSTSLTPQQLEALQKALSLSKEQLAELIQKLKEAGLSQSQSASSQGNQSSPGQTLTSEQIAQALAEMMEGKSVQEILEMLAQQAGQGGEDGQGLQIGTGGVGRGGGPSEMTWKDNPTSSENAEFKDQVLPAAQLRALKESQRVGLSASAPKANDEPGDSTGGVLPADKASGSAADVPVLPRHRQAVREFFEREK